MRQFFAFSGSILLIFFSASVKSQMLRDVNPDIMPRRVVTAFRDKHPDAFIHNWKNSSVFPPHFVVNYTENKVKYRERYRVDGLLLAKSRIYNRGEIPGKWESRARTDFPNRTLVSAVYVIDMHDPKDKKTYWFIKVQTMGTVEVGVYSAEGVKQDPDKLGFIKDQLEESDS